MYVAFDVGVIVYVTNVPETEGVLSEEPVDASDAVKESNDAVTDP